MRPVKKEKLPCVLSTLADLAEKSLDKCNLRDLLEMQQLTPEERVWQLHETLKIGVSRCAIQLKALPFGFCNMPTIQKVTSDYITDFRELTQYEQRYSPAFKRCAKQEQQEFLALMQKIYSRHRGTMIDVCRGVFEFHEDLTHMFGGGIDLAECRAEIDLIQDIERALDEFFTNRLTLRLLIQHVHALNDQSSGNKKDMVGIVNTRTQPIKVLVKAHKAARFMCMRDFGAAPELLVNGQGYEEYFQDNAENQWELAYVHTHLFYIFLEIMKNAARASLERSIDLEDRHSREREYRVHDIPVPPIRVTVPEHMIAGGEDSVGEEFREQAVLKLADTGLGMNRVVLQKAWSYFFSSVKDRPVMSSEVTDFDKGAPLAGFGFGLPISRVLARYFSGDLDVNSIPGKGTDVYLYL